MSAILSFGKVASMLKLVTDDPRYARLNWRIEELFQRDVDEARAIDIAENYLSGARAERPPFFNSLTVVLLPSAEGAGKEPPPESDLREDCSSTLAVGPIRIGLSESEPGGLPRPGSSGLALWDNRYVHALAIDGQHRLAAIKRSIQENGNQDLNFVPILFLILDKEFGFLGSGRDDSLVIPEAKAMRSLFIDLNKKAVPVSKTRNMLLDDRDCHARFIRTFFAASLKFEQVEVTSKTAFFRIDGQLVEGRESEFVCCLPLALVDWHSEQNAKIDNGGHLVSLLGLDWLTDKIEASNAKKYKFPGMSWNEGGDERYKRIEIFARQWEPTIRDEIMKEVEEAKEKEEAYFLSDSVLRAIADRFQIDWARPITRLLLETPTYSDLVKLRHRKNTLLPEFEQWNQLRMRVEATKNKSAKQVYEERLKKLNKELFEGKPKYKTREFEEVLGEIGGLKFNSDGSNPQVVKPLYSLVGQKALFTAFLEDINHVGDMWSDVAESIGVDPSAFGGRNDFMAHFIANGLAQHVDLIQASGRVHPLNNLRVTVERSPGAMDLPDQFWAGALTKKESPLTLDFSGKAAARSAIWIRIFARLGWIGSIGEGDIESLKSELENFKKGRYIRESCKKLIDDTYDTPGPDIKSSVNDIFPSTFLVKALEYPDAKNAEDVFKAAKEKAYLATLDRLRIII